MAVDLSQGLEQDSFRGICTCIAEFLHYEHLDGSLKVFTTETVSRTTRRGLLNSQHVTSEQLRILLRYFDQGDCKGFFSLWHNKASDTLRVDNLHKLEFWLQLYFALYPVLVGQSDNGSLSHTLPVFKQYLDTNGPLLANEPQFLSYYALPYVPRPQSHPAFAHIFTPTFVPDLRLQLSNVLRSAPAKASMPRLYSMYAAAQAALQLPGSAALPSDGESLQPSMTSSQRPPLPHVTSRPTSRAVHCDSRPNSAAAHRDLHSTRRPVSGADGSGLTGSSRPTSGASGRELTGNTPSLVGSASMGLTGNIRPISGRSQTSRRPISALLNGSKELADLVSVSKPRYTDQSAAPSLEPSEVLHVVHSEGSEGGISAEVSLLEGEHSHATEADFQVSATTHAALPDAAAGSVSVSQGSNEATLPSHEMLTQASDTQASDSEHQATLHDAAPEAGGQSAPVVEGSAAALVQRDSTTTASGHEGSIASEAGKTLELLAVSRSSLPASCAVSASEPSSLAASATKSLSSRHLPQARHVGSSASGSRQLRPDSAVKVVSRSRSVGSLAAPHANTNAGSDPVYTTDSAQSSPAPEAYFLSGDLLRKPGRKLGASEPDIGSSQRASLSASSRGPSPVMPNPGREARPTVTAHRSVADMSIADSLPIEASGDSVLLVSGNQPVKTATAADVCSSTSSIAASTEQEHRQTARDVSDSGGPLRYSMSSDGRTAGGEASLTPNNSTARKEPHTAIVGDHTGEMRSSSNGEITQALMVAEPVKESSRSSTNEAAGTSQPRRSPSLSRHGSASISSHAQPERSASPTLPADRGDSKGNPASLMNGQTSVSPDSARESCLTGTSLAAAADQGDNLPGAAPMGSSLKGIDTMGTSLQRSQERAATPVNTSLSQLGKDGGVGVIRHSVILTGLDPLDQWLYRHPSVLASLDYDKVKADLQGGEAGLAAALLQSLRWRLDKAATASDRCQVLASYIEHDLLMLRQPREDMPWSDSASSSSGGSEKWARLIGTLADSQAGRAYLCNSLTPVVQQLCHWLQHDANTSHSHEEAHSLGLSGYALEALQKLSLRRETRSVMAENGVIGWLARQLSQIDTMPLTSLECCGALLMNLAMAKAGRHECQQLGLLVPLESLLEHDSMRLQTYANATLYSLLREPDIRAAAQTKGTDELLRHVQANARPVIARQIECVLKHWHALELDKSDAEEEEAEIDDQEDDDFQDAHTGVGDGLDEAESIHSWDQLHGERLLASHYLQERRTAVCSSQQAPMCTSVSIQDMGVILSPALSQNLTSATSQLSSLGKQMPQHPAPMPTLQHLNSSGKSKDLLPTNLPKLIPAAKQEEYFAAFGSQSKLPRTPLLPGY